jgi:hypothetical protein
VLGAFLLAIGILGHYGFKLHSIVTNTGVGTTQHRLKQRTPFLDFTAFVPVRVGYVAFGDGSARHVAREHLATLRRADTPYQPREVSSRVKLPGENDPRLTQDVNARISHMNHLKQRAQGHLCFKPQDGIRAPLNPST